MQTKIITIVNIRWLLVVWLFSSTALAETYACNHSEGKIYQSTPCADTTHLKKPKAALFDGWMLGIRISDMQEEAKVRGLALISEFSDSALSSQPKESAQIINAPDARQFLYKTRIMDKPTEVRLYFTATSKQLYKIKASMNVGNIPSEERKFFYASLHAQLSKKYGKADDIERDILHKISNDNPLVKFITVGAMKILVGKLQAWGLNHENVITLTYKKHYSALPYYDLTYVNKSLAEKNSVEMTRLAKKKAEQAVAKDAGRL